MLKRLWIFFFISILLIMIGCAPKAVRKPDLYSGPDLSLDELLAKVSRDIDLLKAIADVEIEKDNNPYDSIKASVLLKKPDWLHMRVYKLGMLVRDFVIKDNVLYVISGKSSDKLKRLGTELHHSIFWWEDLEGGIMKTGVREYIIRTENKEIYLDKGTFLPIKQLIRAADNNIYIYYDRPDNNNGFWYPSVMRIQAGSFHFTVKLKKIIKNPSLGEHDFRMPAGS